MAFLARNLLFIFLSAAIFVPYNSAWALPSLTIEPQFSDSFQIAKTTFLPDKVDNLGFADFDTLGDDYNDKSCSIFRFSSCPDGAFCQACPFNASKLRVLYCEPPYFLSGGTCMCPPMVFLQCLNDVCTQYCGNICIKKTCTPLSDQVYCTNGTQDCDNGCCAQTRKCCIECEDLVTSKPEHAVFVYKECSDGTGSHQIQAGWECDVGYHEKDGACEKDCISNPCLGYDLSYCPSGMVCRSCTQTATDCSTDETYYKIVGCRDLNQVVLETYWCDGALGCWVK